MSLFPVIVNKGPPGCLVAAQSKRVLHSFMNCSFVFGKIPLWSCLIVTLPARVLHSFMNCSFVLGKIPLWSCLMVTLPTRVLHPFMKCSFVSGKTPLWSCLQSWKLLRHLGTRCLFQPRFARLNDTFEGAEIETEVGDLDDDLDDIGDEVKINV